MKFACNFSNYSQKCFLASVLVSLSLIGCEAYAVNQVTTNTKPKITHTVKKKKKKVVRKKTRVSTIHVVHTNHVKKVRVTKKEVVSSAPVVQSTPSAPHGSTVVLPGYFEAGLDYDSLNNNYGSWFGQYATLSVQPDVKNNWIGEIHHRREFGEVGTFFGLTNIHNFTDTWYTSIGAGFSDRSSFWQRYSVNATVYHKFGKDLEFVPYLGYIEYWWRTGAKTIYINPGFVYYFKGPWILEGGFLPSRNQPGQVDTWYNYLALTYGVDHKRLITGRAGWGREGYLVTGNNAFEENFPSAVFTLTWREWCGPKRNWGVNAIAESYFSRVYKRNGISLGLFWDI